jgi:hypothetical protein
MGRTGGAGGVEPLQLQDAQRTALAAIGDGEAEHARLFARRMRDRYSLVQLWEQAPGPTDFVILELAGTARIGQVRASGQLTDAVRLVEVLRRTLAALAAGTMFVPTAELLLSLTRNCTEAVAQEVERRVLAQLAELNTRDARRMLAETILQVEAELDPDAAVEREQQAQADRSVWINAAQDRMCQVGATMEMLAGRRWALDFEELVRAQAVADKRAGVVRTRSQRRADVFAALPSQLLALLHAIAAGDVSRLLALAKADPESAEQVEAFADATQDLCHDLDPSLPDLITEIPSEPKVERNDATDAPTDEADELAAEGGCDDGSDGRSRRRPCPVPLTPTREPPPTPVENARTEQPDPPEQAGATDVTGLSVHELAVALLTLPVHDPRVLNVHVPMATVLDLDQRGGWVEDLGPISPYRVRTLLPVAKLRRIVVDNRSGQPLRRDRELLSAVGTALEGLDRTDPVAVRDAAQLLRDRLLSMLTPTVVVDRAERGHDPSRGLDELVALRDRTCTGIGCSQPAAKCDDDHEERWPDGPTAIWNVSAKSRRCHTAKHHGWEVRRDEGTGTSTWRSPLGHSYTSPSAWSAPAAIPDDLELPEPRLVDGQRRPGITDHDVVEHDDPHDPADRPLDQRLPEPPPPPRRWEDEPPF